MFEFGAKLALKDTMYASMKKHVSLQKEFKERVAKSDLAIRSLGKVKATPTIEAKDNATGIVDSVRDTVNTVGAMVATPELAVNDNATVILQKVSTTVDKLNGEKVTTSVEIKDDATKKADEIYQKIVELKRMAVSPVIRLKDLTASTANKIKQRLKEIATTYTPIMRVRDLASQGISKIKNTLGGIQKKYTAVVQAKDVASKVISKIKNNLKAVGKTVAKPFVKIKDGATKILDNIKSTMKSVGSMVAKPVVALKDGASAGLDKLGGMLKTLAKGVTIAVGLAGAGATALLGGSLSEGASLQQSIGGVETLYGSDTGIVKNKADMAYQSAGLSANAYMETITSFSASLLQSLAGDTTKAAHIADQAIIDMADNANKFGTDMESIQDAYQGFAKQNYTMLDNLKLGYGGTQSEMERLLKDATAISGVSYDISNLADVYNAIHVIQDNMGIAGTTAEEASKTFSGSFASMKASAQNLLGNLTLGGDITSSMEALVDSACTFFFDNAIPMIGNIFTALPDAISVAVEKGAPKLKELGGNVVKSIRDGIVNILPSSMSGVMGSLDSILFGGFDALKATVTECMPVVQNILGTLGGSLSSLAPILVSAREAFIETLPDILQAINSVVPVINPIVETMGGVIQAVIPVAKGVISTFSQTIQQVMPIVSQIFSAVSAVVIPIVQGVSSLIQSAFPIIQGVISTVTGAIASVMPTISSVFEGVGGKIQQVVGVVQSHMGLFQGIFETVSPIVQGAVEVVGNVISSVWSIISPIIDVAISIFDALLSCVEKVFPTIQSIIQGVWGVLEGIFGAIADGLGMVGDAISGVAEFVGSGIDTIGSWFGFAYGKDRVPYDNYPAVLHEGEKVLTRNQADQYERAMSTRGVTLSKVAVEPSGGSAGGNTGSNQADVRNIQRIEPKVDIHVSFDGANINNLGDMEQVADATAEIFVKKFRKLVPNMT